MLFRSTLRSRQTLGSPCQNKISALRYRAWCENDVNSRRTRCVIPSIEYDISRLSQTYARSRTMERFWQRARPRTQALFSVWRSRRTRCGVLVNEMRLTTICVLPWSIPQPLCRCGGDSGTVIDYAKGADVAAFSKVAQGTCTAGATSNSSRSHGIEKLPLVQRRTGRCAIASPGLIRNFFPLLRRCAYSSKPPGRSPSCSIACTT